MCFAADALPGFGHRSVLSVESRWHRGARWKPSSGGSQCRGQQWLFIHNLWWMWSDVNLRICWTKWCLPLVGHPQCYPINITIINRYNHHQLLSGLMLWPWAALWAPCGMIVVTHPALHLLESWSLSAQQAPLSSVITCRSANFTSFMGVGPQIGAPPNNKVLLRGEWKPSTTSKGLVTTINHYWPSITMLNHH